MSTTKQTEGTRLNLVKSWYPTSKEAFQLTMTFLPCSNFSHRVARLTYLYTVLVIQANGVTFVFEEYGHLLFILE